MTEFVRKPWANVENTDAFYEAVKSWAIRQGMATGSFGPEAGSHWRIVGGMTRDLVLYLEPHDDGTLIWIVAEEDEDDSKPLPSIEHTIPATHMIKPDSVEFAMELAMIQAAWLVLLLDVPACKRVLDGLVI